VPHQAVHAALHGSSVIAAAGGRVPAPAAVAAGGASSGMAPAGGATPAEQALRWLRNQQVRGLLLKHA
jgi:aryl-alcohol dehydrogenase-like predicted oxidoreductase